MEAKFNGTAANQELRLDVLDSGPPGKRDYDVVNYAKLALTNLPRSFLHLLWDISSLQMSRAYPTSPILTFECVQKSFLLIKDVHT